MHTRTRIQAWDDWLSRSGAALGCGARVEYEHFYFMLEAPSAGLGVGIAPWPYVTDDIRFGKLTAPLGSLESGHEYVALRRARRTKKSSIFCDWIAKEAQDFRESVPTSSTNPDPSP
ncbi:LysR substrate-binding domain-containing protein [Rhizobium ruizarguesonis]|uniref:LysR substrate-binding domain-containing protein n=1 Tax=Rhizobium ruizarguesonis TaxID=2081791 RepID=UPI001FE2240C|nr:LysR substrate-binding domain-containing protein [Rhizobium ruizarguesonis]